MEVFSSNNKGTVHLGGDNGSGKDTATDRNHTGERAFFVCKRSISKRSTIGKHQVYSSSPSSPPWAFPEFPSMGRGDDEELKHTYVGPLNCSLRRPKSKSNVLVPSSSALAHLLALRAFRFGVEEYVRLLLESPLGLHGQFGRHDCGTLSTVMLEESTN